MNTPARLILIADDEEQVGTLASMALKKAGYKTLVAISGHQALQLWTPEVELLVTDCVMPDLFGDQLAARLLEIKPDLKVIFMSGNSIESLELSVPVEQGVNFISKPFQLEELAEIVNARLNSQETRRRAT